MVNVEELIPFSQALAPQVDVLVEEEDVDVAALRASTTRSGTAMSTVAAILPIICGTRASDLMIFAACGLSIMAEARNLVAKRGCN